MKRREQVTTTYPKYVLTRREFKEALGITEKGTILSVDVSFYNDEVVITLNPAGKEH